MDKRINDTYSGKLTRASIKKLSAAMVAESKKLEWVVTVTIGGHRKEKIPYRGVYAGQKGGQLESFRGEGGFAPYTKYISSRVSTETVVSILNSLQQLPLEVVGIIKIVGVPR